MANRERGEVTLVAGGRVYTLRLTTNACCELEEYAGKTSDEVIAGVNRGSFSDVRLLLWMALRDKHPDVATETVEALTVMGDLIDAAGGRAAVIERLRVLVILNSAPEAKGGAARPRKAQARRTGVSSTWTH